ncbi:insulin-like growth factor-binding protein complex acid labile subunit isoform X1 [Sitodiplosis mosellana]|uniref:insulin-like growth factor-binding protein complex acid labile subunit isoform X1 n=2 Tax=Sitodiplosis mosellana TaxID=263140 RepID=UPI002443EFC1|nr:insulin-like growth factor-binding protein complex acid labile subunit isoform X1 [Sitodiplosis mosellana]
MSLQLNRWMIAIFFWLCAFNIQINVVYSYEIKCSNGARKDSLSCTFNYVADNRTLAADMPSDFRPFTKYITHLTLGIANLTTLPNDTFGLLPNLNSFSARVDIQKLSQRQFKNATKLMILSFGFNNRLTKLESQLFKHAPSLEYIDFGFNQINEIEDKAFRGLINLKTLFLEANSITQIRNKTFTGTKNLQRLDLSKNQINDIQTGSFVHMSKLKTIHLNQNRIGRLQAGLFSGFRMIERIDLSVNAISEVEDGVFEGLTTLNILELGFNRLMTLPEGFLNGVPNLVSLFLAQNQIEEIHPDLGNLTKLTVLDLSYNPILHMDPEVLFGLDKLESLETRGCNLTQLDPDVFINQQALETLDLSENNITTVEWNIFLPLERLKFLKLEANHIAEIENYTNIKAFLPNLEFINLSRNEIDCDTVAEMIDYFKNNTIEYEWGEEVDVGCQLLPLRSRAIQAYQLSNAKFNAEALRLINLFK